MQNEPIIITTSTMSNDDAISWMREKIKAADDLQALYKQEELLDLKLMQIRAQIDECVDLCSIEIQSSN